MVMMVIIMRRKAWRSLFLISNGWILSSREFIILLKLQTSFKKITLFCPPLSLLLLLHSESSVHGCRRCPCLGRESYTFIVARYKILNFSLHEIANNFDHFIMEERAFAQIYVHDITCWLCCAWISSM